MITRDNIKAVVDQISAKDKKRIARTNKEYIVLLLHVCNSGSTTEVILTNNFTRYQYVSKAGNCILSADDPIFDPIFDNCKI